MQPSVSYFNLPSEQSECSISCFGCLPLTQGRDDIAQCDQWLVDAATFLESFCLGAGAGTVCPLTAQYSLKQIDIWITGLRCTGVNSARLKCRGVISARLKRAGGGVNSASLKQGGVHSARVKWGGVNSTRPIKCELFFFFARLKSDSVNSANL